MSYAAMIKALSALLDISIMKKLFADSMKCPLLYSTTLSRLRLAAWLTTVLLWRLPTGRLAILCPLRLVWLALNVTYLISSNPAGLGLC